MEIAVVEQEVTEQEVVFEPTTKREFFCGPEGELEFKNGFIYNASGDVIGSYRS